jgi:hypothetical protein
MENIDSSAGFRILTLYDFETLAISILTYCLLFLAGRCFVAKSTHSAIYSIVGFTLSYVFFVICAFFFDKFSVHNIFYLNLVFAFIGSFRERQNLKKDVTFLTTSILMVSPLLYLASINGNPLWDDFTNWLPPAKHLFEFRALPTTDNPDIFRSTQNYPFSRAMFHAWVSELTGHFHQNTQGIFGILLSSSVLMWGGKLAGLSSGTQRPYFYNLTSFGASGVLSWLLIIWTLTLNTRMIISSYADPTLSLAFLHLFFFLISTELEFKRSRQFEAWFSLSILFLFPSIIKSTGFIFAFSLLLIFYFIYPMDFRVRTLLRLEATKHFIKTLTFTVLPTATFLTVWNLYCRSNNLHSPLVVKNLENWNYSSLDEVTGAIIQQLLGRPYLLIGLTFAAIILIRCLRLKNGGVSNQRALITAMIFGVFMVIFHFIAYLAIFSENEAQRAASFSRYIAPAGLVIWGALTLLFIEKTKKTSYSKLMLCGLLTFTFFTMLVVSSNKKIVLASQQRSLKEIAEFLDTAGLDKKNILVLDLLGSGLNAVNIMFYLDRKTYKLTSYRAYVLTPLTPQDVKKLIGNAKNILIYSASKHQRLTLQNYIYRHPTVRLLDYEKNSK